MKLLSERKEGKHWALRSTATFVCGSLYANATLLRNFDSDVFLTLHYYNNHNNEAYYCLPLFVRE
jgi:hypothetical protein